MSRTPSEAERRLVAPDGEYTLHEAARSLLEVKPDALPGDEREDGK